MPYSLARAGCFVTSLTSYAGQPSIPLQLRQGYPRFRSFWSHNSGQQLWPMASSGCSGQSSTRFPNPATLLAALARCAGSHRLVLKLQLPIPRDKSSFLTRQTDRLPLPATQMIRLLVSPLSLCQSFIVTIFSHIRLALSRLRKFAL